MFKSIKNPILKWILVALVAILALVLGLYLIVYLSIPTYKFEETRPFSGEYLYNPYQDMNPTQWKKCNFHCHSRKYFGLTDGRKSTERAIDSVYSYLGYDHYGISDYMHINPYGAEKEGYIPSYEHGYSLFRKTHQLCIGAESVYRIDYPFMQNLNMKQHMLNQLGKRTRFVVPAHASFTKGYKVSDMKYLSNYRLLEILNPYGKALEHWDMALSNGHLVYGIGDDDTHDIHAPKDVCLFMTVVNSPNIEAENTYQALEKGRCYTVEFNNYFFHPQPLSFKAEKARDLPMLTRAELIGDTLFIETEADNLKEMRFIGQGGQVLKTEQNVKTGYYVIQPEDSYVRTEINIDDLHLLYLNPVTRHQTPFPTDRLTFSVNQAQTWMYRFVYIVVVAAFLWYLFTKAKAKQEEHRAN